MIFASPNQIAENEDVEMMTQKPNSTDFEIIITAPINQRKRYMLHDFSLFYTLLLKT